MDVVASPSRASSALPQRSDAHAPAGEDALTALVALLHDDLQACNRTIVARMDSPVELIPQLAAHIVAAGGKRLRPLLTLAAARLCGYAGDRHVKLAACVEFIHTATLLHDDVVDESLLRRGLASANAVFGNQASVLVGDFLFARAFQLMVEDGSLVVLGILSRAAATIAEGEVLQLVTQNDLTTSEARYLEVIKGKTAALFAAACEVGAVVADRPQREAAALAEFGLNLGHRVPVGGRRAGLRGGPGGAGQDRRRRLPRGQDHAAGAGGLSGGRCRRSRLLAPHHRGERAERGRSRPRAASDGALRRHPRHARARAWFCRRGEGGAGARSPTARCGARCWTWPTTR